MRWIYSLIFRGQSLCVLSDPSVNHMRFKSRFSGILITHLWFLFYFLVWIGTGDSAAQCSFLLLTMIRKDPICVTNGGGKKKTKTSRLLLTCWFLLQKLSQDEPTASDPTAQETNDQPAESEAPPPTGTNRPVDVYDQQVVLVHVMYGMFLSLRWRESHAVVKKLLRGLLSSYSLRADEERPQDSFRCSGSFIIDFAMTWKALTSWKEFLEVLKVDFTACAKCWNTWFNSKWFIDYKILHFDSFFC